jgi:hypothetical protein
MHSSNYTAKDWPLELHSDYESYGMAVQARYVATAFTPTSGDAAAQLTAAARASKPHWPVLRAAVTAAYAARGCGKFSSYWTDHTSCWQGDAAVDNELGVELRAAQAATASYLIAADLR